MDAQAGRNLDGSVAGVRIDRREPLQIRPQHSCHGRMPTSSCTLLGVSHDLKYGFGFRHVLTATGEVEWPGNGIVAIEQTATDRPAARAGVPAGPRRQHRQLPGLLRRRHDCRCSRATIDVGVRYDRQWGSALAVDHGRQQGVSRRGPRRHLRRLRLAVHLEELLAARRPRATSSNDTGKTVARASYSRFAGQLAPSTVGTMNPTTGSTPGSVTYRLERSERRSATAQANEVDLTQQLGAPGGGFDRGESDGVASLHEQGRSQSRRRRSRRASSPASSGS